MKMPLSFRKAIAMLALSAAFFPAGAQAQDADNTLLDKVDLSAVGTLQYITEDDMDLGTAGAGSGDSLSEQLSVRAKVDVNPDWFVFAHGRALNIDGETGFDDDTGDNVNSNDEEDAFLELRELYVTRRNLFNVVPLSLQVGRQRVREPRSLWWNSDNDLVRLSYDSTLYTGFLAAGEDMWSYRTGDGTDYQEDDEDRFRILGESSLQYVKDHFIEGRFLYENDHSGIEDAGTIIDAFDRDNEDQDVVWVGARAAGTAPGFVRDVSTIKYRADLIGLFGEEDTLESAAGPGAGQRTVTGSDSRDVRAWAFDAGAIVDPFTAGGPVATLGYAFGSGDDDPTDGTANDFRQSDIQGSSSRFGLERSQQRNYGEVFRPELSNVHVMTAGLALPVTEATDASLTWFHYRLDEEDTGLRSSGIRAPLNGDDSYLGQEADFIFNVDVDKQFDIAVPHVEGINFRVSLGGFFPGDAYEPDGDDNAYRAFSEIQLRF